MMLPFMMQLIVKKTKYLQMVFHLLGFSMCLASGGFALRSPLGWCPWTKLGDLCHQTPFNVPYSKFLAVSLGPRFFREFHGTTEWSLTL